MIFKIPGQDTIEIENVLLDYNGTMAIDGKLVDGVDGIINALAEVVNFHVITADTFGTVKEALQDVSCRIVTIPEESQDVSKLDYLMGLGKEKTLCVGNGKNDCLMLKESVLGIALILDEGACVETVMAADIVCKSIIDVFAYFTHTKRLIATLRN